MRCVQESTTVITDRGLSGFGNQPNSYHHFDGKA